jgi:hypothetical protein
VAIAALILIEIGGVAGWSLAAKAAMDKQWVMLGTAGALGAICVGNALVNGATFAWGKHSARQATVEHQAKLARANITAAQARVTELHAQLKPLDGVRSGSAILADLRECEANGCRKLVVESLRSERDRARERDGLASALQAAQQQLDNTKAAPLEVSALGGLLHELWGLSPARVDLIAALLYVALLQLAAPLTAALAAFVGHQPLAQQPAAAAPAAPPGGATDVDIDAALEELARDVDLAPAQQPVPKAPAAAKGSVPSVARRPLKLVSSRAERVVQLVQQAGGELRSVSRAIAAQLGVDGQTLSHAIKEAVEAGVLINDSNRRGTVLRLA